MSHYLQYPQQHIQQLDQVYPSKQQQQQKQSSPTMTYYNNIQVPMTLGIPAASNEGSLEMAYLSGLGLNLPTSSSGSSANLAPSNDSGHSNLANIRRDSGFAHSSLDEMSLGIMSDASRHGLKGTNQASHNNALPGLTNLNGYSTTASPSILVTSSTADAEGSTPIVPSMSSSVLSGTQRMYLVQQSQQQQQQPTTTPSSTPLCTAYSDSWAIASVPTSLTTFPSGSDHAPDRASYPNNGLVTAVYGQQLPMNVVPSQQHSPTQQSLLSPVQYTPKQTHIQRPRQRKPQLQITTDSEANHQMSMMGSNVDVISSGYSTPSIHWEQPYDMTQCSVPASSPSMAAANNIVQASQQGYPWGLVSSPIESSFSSGASTPLFASPPSSYAHSEMAPSCESSRAASPMTPPNAFDPYMSERRIKRMEDGSIVRSRKSSTSSSSSLGSQRRTTNLRGSTSPSSPRSNQTGTTTSSPTHQCPKCGQCFAGPAVLVRHIESIHDKLLWNCVGCKSNLSRRDAVTRHINLSPMDSICRAVGTIGQVKTSNGVEVHYEVSSYRAKPLDEVMNRMGKKISAALRKEIDRSKAAMQQREAAAAAAAAASASLPIFPEGAGMPGANMMMMAGPSCPMVNAMDSMVLHSEEEEDTFEDGSSKKRRRSLVADLDAFGRKKK
ncbi:hypothetical protein BGX34_009685 [Mortierella sp. NVP85]|nr:hypothetical protein BGX34_009685 [Mortierella sp. NVP85]